MSKLRATPSEKECTAFRGWVMTLLKDNNETLEDLGAVIGISGVEIGNKLRGKHVFSLPQIVAICEHYEEEYTIGRCLPFSRK